MVVNLQSLPITANHCFWFWVVAGEQPNAQELSLSKPFLVWKSHEFWLLTRLLLCLGFGWTENIFRKGDHLISLQSWAQTRPESSEGSWTEFREWRILMWIKMHLTEIFVTFKKKYDCITIQLCCLGSYTSSGSVRLHHKTSVTVAQHIRQPTERWPGLAQCFLVDCDFLNTIWMLKLWKSVWHYLLNSTLKQEHKK